MRWLYGLVIVAVFGVGWVIGQAGYSPAAVATAGTVAQTASPSPAAANDKTAYTTTFLDTLAGDLGVERAQLDQAVRDAANQTVDTAITNGQLTEQQATPLRERINEFPNVQWGSWGKHGGGPGGGAERGWGGAWSMANQLGIEQVVEAVATRLDMTGDELQNELQSGKAPLAIAQERGVSEADLRAAISDAVKTQLDAAVQTGTLTQQQADMLQQRIQNVPLDRSGFGSSRGPWTR